MNDPDNFRRYLEMPHRRPAYGVNSPAVFRHLVFRIDDPSKEMSENPLRAEDYDGARTARNQFIARLNERLLSVQECCHAERKLAFARSNLPASSPSGSSSLAKQSQVKDIAYIDINRTLLTELRPGFAAGDRHGWRVRLLVDFHSEYYSLTFILDQPNDSLPTVSGDAALAQQYEILLSERPEPRTVPSSDLIKFFYDDVWQRIEPHICGFISGTPGQPADENLGMPGTRLTEFRAVALRDLKSNYSPRIAEGNTPRKIFLPGNPDADKDFSQSRFGLREWVMHNGDFVRDLLKFNQLTQSLDRDANCVLCEVLDGGAIFGSSLGQIPLPLEIDDLKTATPQTALPLRYFVVYNALSKYQLGRLIRRHHVLGELRIAALIDHDLVVRAGAQIRALGNEVDGLLVRSRRPEDKTTLSARDLRTLQEKLHNIHSEVKPGGLSYRVARSRYYADIFEKRVKELRIHRLEGFEPYDVFIARSLYQVFNFISTVGTRYTLLAERLSRLAITHEMERTAILTAEISDVQKKVLKIQRLGEAIGIGAFAYYVGHIITVFLNAAIRAACIAGGVGDDKCNQRIEKISEYMELAGIIIALFIAARYLSRIYDWWMAKADERDAKVSG